MAPRVTLHSPSSGSKQRHNSISASKGKERLPVPMNTGEDADMASDEMDELAEDTVDSLDDPNTTQPQWETISSSAPGKVLAKKPRPKPPAVRTPGQSLVSMSRIDTIVNADPTTGPLSREAVFVVALAAEDFIRRLTRVAQSRSKHDSRAITTYNDFADTAHYFPEFNFLKDIIPKTMSMKEAFAERDLAIKRREAQLNGIDPDNKEAAKDDEGNSHAARLNGKAVSKSEEPSEDMDSLSIQSERQKSKKPRLNRAEDAETKHPNGKTARSVSSASHLGRTSKKAAPDSNNSTSNGAVKIRIRPPRAKHSPPPVPKSEHPSPTQTPQSDDEPHPQTEESREIGRNNANGKTSGILPLSPVPISTDRAPLWTNVPLPPPPSPRGHKHLENGHHPLRTVRDHKYAQGSVSNTEAGFKVRNATQHHPPHNRERTPVNLRELIAENALNPGRTIYSQR